MIVKSFIANGVFGYLDFKIQFNRDVSFLVGGNGSGKTTALKLMNALVTPNFFDLLQIPFETIALTVSDNHEQIEISAESSDTSIISLRVSGIEQALELPSYSHEEFEFTSRQRDRFDEMMEEISRKHADHEVVRKISNIESPIFLGLDRRHEQHIGKHTGDYYRERSVWLHESASRSLRTRRLIRGSIGASLMETEMLVQNSYRRIRVMEDKHSSELRDSILLSVFQYSKLESDVLGEDLIEWEEKSGLLKRQKEIKDALSNIGINDTRLGEEADKFFNQITALFESVKNTQEGITVEWLLNKAQIERMARIVEIIDEHKSKNDSLFKPINDFLSTVNEFYSDSNKELELDTVGQLIVRRPNDTKCTIEGLSSGERQLLVIIAHSFFNRHDNKNAVFIIDEPELSLHLGWQEKFAETIFSIKPDSQYILATHSPEIIGVRKNKAVKCR